MTYETEFLKILRNYKISQFRPFLYWQYVCHLIYIPVQFARIGAGISNIDPRKAVGITFPGLPTLILHLEVQVKKF